MPKSLKSKTIVGVFWSAIERFSSLGIQMICTLIIANILTPEDFGILGMITVFTALGMVIVDSGFGLALIRNKEVSPIDYSSVFYLNIIFAIISYAILFLLSPFIAKFYGIESLTQICRITFLILPINAFGLIQNTILIKQVDFKSISLVSLFSALLSGILGIILAYCIRNVWALVIQNISMYFLRSVFLWLIGRWHPIFQFSISSIKSMWSYSINLLGFGLISSITHNLYPLLIGKIYNATQLGYYSQADKLQRLPSSCLSEVVQRVCFPIMSEVKDDKMKLRNAYSNIIICTIYVIFPLMMLLIGTANELIPLLLGSQWYSTIPFFKILCITGALYPWHSINLNILNVVGKSKLSLHLEILRKSLLIIFIVIFARFDILIFVWMQVIYGIVVLFLNMYFCGNEIDYSVIRQLIDVSPTILISMFSVTILFLIPELSISLILIFMFKVIVFLLIYFWTNKLFHTRAQALIWPIIINFKKRLI